MKRSDEIIDEILDTRCPNEKPTAKSFGIKILNVLGRRLIKRIVSRIAQRIRDRRRRRGR